MLRFYEHLCRSRGCKEQLAVFVNYQGLKPCARIVASHLSDGGDPAIAMAYIAGQTVVDTWDEYGKHGTLSGT